MGQENILFNFGWMHLNPLHRFEDAGMIPIVDAEYPRKSPQKKFATTFSWNQSNSYSGLVRFWEDLIRRGEGGRGEREPNLPTGRQAGKSCNQQRVIGAFTIGATPFAFNSY